MLNIFLLRHAESPWSAHIDDHVRPLSDAGKTDALTLAKYINVNNLVFDNVLCSSSNRTRDTLSIIKEYAPHLFQNVDYLEELYNASKETILEVINKHNSSPSLLAVGHNPGISQLISGLAGLEITDFPPCVLAHFTIDNDMDISSSQTLFIVKPAKREVIHLL